MISRSDIAAHLESSLKVGFLKGRNNYSPLRSAFCGQSSSDGAFEMYGDFGDAPMPVQTAGQSGSTGQDSRTGAERQGGLNVGGGVTIFGLEERALQVYNRDWSITFAIEHNAINDNRVGSLVEYAMRAGRNFEKHKDYLAFNALNVGEGTTVGKGYDGLSFFNDSHIDPNAEYQTAQDNKFALTLSLANFNTAFINAGKFLDSRGQPPGYSHTLLIHALDLRNEAAQIADNPFDNSTANRAINVNNNLIQRLAAPGGWLDSTAWFIVDASDIAKPINLQERQAPQMVMWDDHSQGSGIRYYKFHARYEVFYGDWRLAAQGNT